MKTNKCVAPAMNHPFQQRVYRQHYSHRARGSKATTILQLIKPSRRDNGDLRKWSLVRDAGRHPVVSVSVVCFRDGLTDVSLASQERPGLNTFAKEPYCFS